MIKTIIGMFQFLAWLRKQKRYIENDVKCYLSESRAKEWRLYAEKTFYALSTGNNNIKNLPKFIQWLFSATEADNAIGEFGLYLLKSNKLASDDKKLKEPIKSYPCH